MSGFSHTTMDSDSTSSQSTNSDDDLQIPLDSNGTIFDGIDPLRLSSATQAVINNHPEVLQDLIGRGQSVTNVDNRGWSALHHAAFLGRTKCLRILLKHGGQ